MPLKRGQTLRARAGANDRQQDTREAIGGTEPLAGLALTANFNRPSTVRLAAALCRRSCPKDRLRRTPPSARTASAHVDDSQFSICRATCLLSALATGAGACECPIGVRATTGLAALRCGYTTGEREPGGDLIRLSTLPTAANTIQYLAGRADGTRTALARDSNAGERQRHHTRAAQDL